MKTYISTGIGDMMALDAVMSPEEKESITEMYWASRFGSNLIPLFENNSEYPNLIKHHQIDDEEGKKAMATLDPVAVPFWHFRPDFHPNFEIGLKLFGIEDEEIQVINVIERFAHVCNDIKTGVNLEEFYFGSSFIKNASQPTYSNYILFHYPTSTRPRNDIAGIDSDDWKFVENLSKETSKSVVVISDHDIEIPLSNYELLVNPDIKLIIDLVAHCDYYAGCDSFCGILSTKRLPKEKIYMKTHDRNIKSNLKNNPGYLHCYFLPHSPEDIIHFYKPYIGEP